MKRGTSIDFVFSNLLSGYFNRSTICFHPDGTRILIPQGNRLIIFDVIKGESRTHYIEHPMPITCVTISEKDDFVLTSDKENNVFISQLGHGSLLYRHNFKKKVTALKFGPKEFGFAVGVYNKVKLFEYPSKVNALRPFIKMRPPIGASHNSLITKINFSNNGELIATCSNDNSVHILLSNPNNKIEPFELRGHRGNPLFAYFSNDDKELTTLGTDGTLFIWEIDGKDVKIVSRRRLGEEDFDNPKTRFQNIKLADCNGETIVTGYSNGTFKIYPLIGHSSPVISSHDVKFSATKIKSLVISQRYAAFTSKIGEMVIWDILTATVVQRSQCHLGGVSCFAYSPNGVIIATGDDHGKIKLWDSQSGVCVATFSEHEGRITGVDFGESGRTVASSSTDGTINIYDAVRGQKFRTFTTNIDETESKPQFTSVALNKQCTMVAASTAIDFCGFIWSLQKDGAPPLMKITGHEAPITALKWTAMSKLLTASQDKTIRITDIFNNESEVLDCHEMVTAASISPDESCIVSACSNGKLYFYELRDTDYVETYDMNISEDFRGGRRKDSLRSAQKSHWYFETIDFSPDGSFIVCGGRSKFICVYSIRSKMLMRRFTHTINTSISGVDEYIQKIKGETGAERTENLIFGVNKRVVEAEARCVKWCPTGRGISAATQEGLLVYVTADQVIVDPIDLESDVTPSMVLEALSSSEFVRAVVLALRLGKTEHQLLLNSVLSVPDSQIDFVSSHLPVRFVPNFLEFISESVINEKQVELFTKWMKSVLKFHTHSLSLLSTARSASHSVQKALSIRVDPIKRIARSNLDTLTFICSQPLLENK